jgi:hypothetical protein
LALIQAFAELATPVNASAPTVVAVVLMKNTLAKALEPLNASIPILVRVAGKLTETIVVASLNAEAPILVTPSGIVTSPVQFLPLS